jgi:DNA replication protein DnaC
MTKRFTNPNTAPDPDDPLIRKVRRDCKELFGHDPLETAVDFAGELNRIRELHCSPEFQAEAAKRREEDAERERREKAIAYNRQLERLSPFHVEAVQVGCNKGLTPLTTTDIQRQVMDKWDGVESMFLLGVTAIGKTYAATWCAMRAARRGLEVASTTALRVCEATAGKMMVYRQADLLILDQLHTLRSPSGKDMPAWQVAPVVDLIDWRYERKLITIAAGTVGPDAMVEILGEDVNRRFPRRLTSESTDITRREHQ